MQTLVREVFFISTKTIRACSSKSEAKTKITQLLQIETFQVSATINYPVRLWRGVALGLIEGRPVHVSIDNTIKLGLLKGFPLLDKSSKPLTRVNEGFEGS